MEKRQQNSLWAWIVWAAAAAFTLYQFLLQASTSVMIPCLEKAFHVGVSGVGFLSSSFFYTYIVMQIPAGLLVDRFGARRILTLCLLICALSAVWFAHSKVFISAECARMLMGLVTAPAVPAALYVGSNWFSCERFALVAGCTEMLGMIGGAIGQAFLAHCVGDFGWRNTFLLCAAVGIFLAIVVWILVRDRPVSDHRVLHEHHQVQTWQRLKMVLHRRQAWWNGLFIAFSFTVASAFAGLWAVPFLQTLYQTNLQTAANASATIFIGIAFGGPVLGAVSDRMKRRKPVMWAASLGCLVFSLLVIYAPLPLSWMFVALFMLGFFSGIYILPFAIMSEITHAHCRGTAMGYTNMMGIFLGSLILQPVIGLLLKTMGAPILHQGVEFYSIADYHKVLAVMPLMFVLALLVLPFIRETFCKDLTHDHQADSKIHPA